MRSLSELCNELIFYVQLLTDMRVQCELPVLVNEDNQACITLAESEQFKRRTKHIHIKYHHVVNKVSQSFVKLKYCQSECNVADIMTKPLTFLRHEEMSKKLGLDSHIV